MIYVYNVLCYTHCDGCASAASVVVAYRMDEYNII